MPVAVGAHPIACLGADSRARRPMRPDRSIHWPPWGEWRAACLFPVMHAVRLHADEPSQSARSTEAPPHPTRLNLLLSDAGWQPESWADRLAELLQPMGVTTVRARSGRQASAVIREIPVHLAVVDLGLPMDAGDPDGGSTRLREGGPRLLDLLARLDRPPPTVVVKRMRALREERREIAEALRAGAFAVLDRPRDARGMEVMLDVLRRALRRYYQGRWPDS